MGRNTEPGMSRDDGVNVSGSFSQQDVMLEISDKIFR